MKRKKVFFLPFGAVALTMALASAAFACTVFRGTFTVQGNATRGKVTTTGSATGMTQTVNSGVAKATAEGGSIKIWTGADAYGRTLPANTYFVRYYNSTAQQYNGPNPVFGTGPGYTDHYHWWTDCMVGGPGVDLGTVQVGASGKITKQPASFALPSSTPDTAPQESAVCIADRGAAFGNQAPLTIV